MTTTCILNRLDGVIEIGFADDLGNSVPEFCVFNSGIKGMYQKTDNKGRVYYLELKENDNE